MEFHFLGTHWVAYGLGRTWRIGLHPSGYFVAEGEGRKQVTRTHFEALQLIERWEQAHVEESETVTL